MEYKKPILLSKFDITLENLSNIKFSNKFRNVFLLKEDGNIYLYETNKTNNNYIQLERLAWKHANVKRAQFSSDGRFLITINNNTNDIEIFDLTTKSNINLYCKELLANFKKFLSNWDCRIELTEQSDLDIVLFTETRLVLSLDLRWIISLEWPGLTSVIFAFEMASCARTSVCNSLLYSLTADGILSAFSLTTGEQLNGIINLADPLYESEQTFVDLVSAQDGHFVAATTSSGRIHLADIIDCFTYQIKPIELVSNSSARSDSDTLSFTSTTKSISSKLSFKSTSSFSTSFRSETSHESRPTHSKEKIHKSTWNNYLNSLQINKSSIRLGIPEKLVSSRNYVSLPKPIIYLKPDEGYSTTHGCWLTAGGLSVWFSSETDQQYRLYDPANGRCLWRIPLPEGSIILGASLVGPTDLWLLKDGFLALYVGNLAKDLLFSKLLQNIPIETLAQLLYKSQWPANLYLSPASLIDRIRHGDFNLAKLVFAVQRNTDLGLCPDDVFCLDTLFELIYPVLFEPNIQESNVQQLYDLTLDYLLYLLEMLHNKQSLLNFIQFEPQAEQTEELKKRFINHLTNLITWQSKKKQVKMDYNESVNEALNRMDSRWCEWQNNLKLGDDVSVIRESVLTRSFSLLHTCYLSHPSYQITTKTFLERIKQVANEWILYLCTERLYTQAEDVIAAMGHDHRSILREISLNTFNIPLRDGLLEELLKKNDWISKDEVESWHFIQQIENVLNSNPDIKYEHFTLEDLNIYQITTNKSTEWKTFVRIELFFKTLDSSLEKDINSENAWDYLLKTEQINLIKDWIGIYLADESKRVDSPLKEKFLKWGLHQTLIDSLEKHTSVISEAVLDYLSTFGRFTTNEKQQLASILSRLLNSNSLESLQTLFNKSSANLTYKEFHFLVINYLINNDFPQAAFPCLMDFIVDEESNFIIELPEDHWWHLWRVFKIWSKNTKDLETFQSATVASVEFLSTAKSPLLEAALVLLRGESLNETFSQEDHTSNLAALPLLHLALKFNAEKSPDITIYQLLQGRTPFDISKLFLWLQENDQEEMPHFAHPRFVAKYGPNVTYDYLACLRDARPCYATAMFISQQKEKYGKLIKKMRNEACGYAHGLALQRYSDPRLVAACIAFVNLVGGNINSLRIHTNVARTVELHLEQFAHIQTTNLLKQQIGDILGGLIKKKKSAQGVLMLLERSLQESKISRISGQMILWDLAIQMAQLHQLPLPEGFLIKCARNDLWLPFIVFLELYQYPLQQAIKLVRNFKSPALQDHLYHALNYEVEDPPQVAAGTRLAQRDARKLLYTRIGLSKQTSNSESSDGSPPCSATIPASILDSEDDCTASVLSVSVTGDIGVRDPSRDLFLVLLECHANADPPRALLARSREYANPVLALLATCYEPSSMVASLCTWLVVSLSEHMPSNLLPEFTKATQNDIWTSRHLESLLETCVEQGRVATLANGFKIFLPDNPLCDFTDFLMQCVLKKNFKDILNLKLFKMACMNLKNNPIADQTDDPEGLFLSNGHWIANQVIRMTNLALGHCFTSAYQQLTFLQTLCQNGFTGYLAVKPPDYHHWSKLIECLINNGTGVYLDLTLLSRDGEATALEYRRVIDELISRQHFDDALLFAGLANCSKDAIVIAQGHIECEQLLNSEQKPTQTFWEKCNRTFQNANVEPANAVKFFKEYSEKIITYKDKFLILRFALNWQRLIPSTEDSYACLEKAMWSFWLLDDTQQPLDNMDSTIILITKSRLEILKNATMAAVASDNLEIDHNYELTKIDSLIRQLLERNQIVKACRVASMFNHKSQDLEMLLTCLELAEGDISPYELTSEQRIWLSEPSMTSLASFRRRTTSRNTPRQSSSSTFTLTSLKYDRIDDTSWQYLSCSLASEAANISQNNPCVQDTVHMLENLCARASHGRKLAMRILACYRLSAYLDMSFLQIWQIENPLELLSQINRNDSDETHALVSDLLIASQVSKQNLAQFLADHIVEAIDKEEKIVWGCDLESHFHMLLDLCDDPSLLGEALVSRTTKSTNPSCIVELLIRAHDAFSNACNMEGIADILTRARTLINTLQSKKLWPLMVRLLIGVGRYNEMNYIFQILKENDQFESLLGRGFFKENGFKLALLEFLRRRCPSDRELYRIAALHFGMHSELAEMWEAEALDVLKRFLKHSGGAISDESWLPCSEDTLPTLRHIMEGYTHAAQYYLQADKLNRALSSAYWAELVALQISLVPSDNSLTNEEENRAILLLLLAPARVSQIINNYLSFPQACIVVRAYSHPVDWSAALYSHCILQGDETYLTHFTHTTPLTTSLVEEVARRYQSETQVTSAMAAQMRRFVKAIGPVDIKYRIASQLGFRDILESMLNGAELAYLKDTVWRRGFSLHPYL